MMNTRRGLERRLATLETFENPDRDLEQYPTPADLAAHLIHDADLRGDLEGTVVDLGTGTGVLALGVALREPDRVVGVEQDSHALSHARVNQARLDPPTPVAWLRGDATRPAIRTDDATVVMNPPFGAQRGNRHADRGFLEAAAEVAAVSYSIHNAGSEAFVEAVADDAGATVTHAFEGQLDLDRQFDHHAAETETITAEMFRIEWV
jgi:putative methylase